MNRQASFIQTSPEAHCSPGHSRYIAATFVLLLGLIVGCSPSNDDVLIFEEVTLNSGLEDTTGMTYGAFWGDYNADGLPDLYTTNHLNDAQLFKNTGNGHFLNTTENAFGHNDIGGDKHGAAWADFNNDGQLDLVQLTGAVVGVGSEPKKLFVNQSGHLSDIAKDTGLANIYGRTRMPLWLDLDNNGTLDVFHGAEARFDTRSPPFFFLQNDDTFLPAKQQVEFASRSVPFCILAPLNSDKKPELICRVIAKNQTSQIIDFSTLPATTLDLLPVTAFEDIAAGDFNNDGTVDLFLARKNAGGRVSFGQPASHLVIVDVTSRSKDFNTPTGFTFKTEGELNFTIKAMHPKTLDPEQISIGSHDLHPATLQFTVSSETAGINNNTAHNISANADRAVVIQQMKKGHWQVAIAGKFARDDKSKFQQLTFKISSDSPINNIAAFNNDSNTEEAPARLYMNRAGQLVEESDKRGVNEPLIAASNVVAADFDNDMDLDLFVVASGDLGKQHNILLINDGKGYFEPADGAGGAAGSLHGVGDSVTTADFDQDGFVDILVTTGFSMGRSLGLASDAGGYHLYRNRGNDNHWLTIDLEGTKSNRDGIGAVVTLTAGGVTQTRVQDGGIHHRGQNEQILHFGLGKHQRVEKISIFWPSGLEQHLQNIDSRQRLHIVEPIE